MKTGGTAPGVEPARPIGFTAIGAPINGLHAYQIQFIQIWRRLRPTSPRSPRVPSAPFRPADPQTLTIAETGSAPIKPTSGILNTSSNSTGGTLVRSSTNTSFTVNTASTNYYYVIATNIAGDQTSSVVEHIGPHPGHD